MQFLGNYSLNLERKPRKKLRYLLRLKFSGFPSTVLYFNNLKEVKAFLKESYSDLQVFRILEEMQKGNLDE